MHILLTGATGFLGHRTLERLLRNPAIRAIRATGRQIRPEAWVPAATEMYRLGDLADPQFTDAQVRGVDVIVHAAALTSLWGPYEDFHRANVTAMQNLIASARRHGIKRFVFVSTPSVYITGRSRLDVRESDPLPARFVNHYATTKRAAELLLGQSELPHIILRPRALIGRGDTIIMPRLIRAFEAGRLKVIGDGRNVVDLTSVENAAAAIECTLFAGPDALGQAYNITNGAPVLLWDFVEDVLHRLGYPFERRHAPVWLATAAGWLLETSARLRRAPEPALSVYSVGALAHSFTLNIEKARTLLGYQPAVSTEQALQEFVEWYGRHRANSGHGGHGGHGRHGEHGGHGGQGEI